MYAIPHPGRHWLAGIGCLLLAAAAAPAMAQAGSCSSSNPMARISPDHQTVPETTGALPTVVTLNGSGSTPNSNLGFNWTQLSGPAATLANPGTATPTFAAPVVGPAGATLTFRLQVNCGAQTNSRDTNITITDVATSSPPTAVASANPESALEGEIVTLDGSASYDIDNTPDTSGLTFLWEQIGTDGLAVTGGVTFQPDATSAVVTFVAPNTPTSVDGTTLTFRLTVRDDDALAGSDATEVTILWLNDPPSAVLACPANGVIEVDEGGPVVLDGSGSSDSDDGIALYEWSQGMGLPLVDFGTPGPLDDTIAFDAPSLGYHQIGSVPFTLTVHDHAGDHDSASCSIFINDVTAPVIAVPADIVAEADSAAGTAVAFEAWAQDAVDDEFPYGIEDDCAPPSGTVFPLGVLPTTQATTPVTCAAVDSAGNPAQVGFNVTVRDTTPPTIQVPGSFFLEATGPTGATADYGPIATSDAVDGDAVADCAPASGTVFPLGTTQVDCEASDARGNAAGTTGFALTVHDTTGPVFGPVGAVTAEATSSAGASVGYTLPTATDLVDGPVAVTCAPAPGSTFALGTTGVLCSAQDGSGNASNLGFDVTVEDTTAPTVALPGDLVAEATSAAGAVVAFSASAADLVDGTVDVFCAPASGTTFALGAAGVLCSATDAAGNTADGGFTVTVVDTTPPLIDPHDDVGPIEATGPGGAQVFYGSPATSDAVDGAGIAVCEPPSGTIFAIGDTAVSCAAVDAAANPAVPTTFDVSVVDTTAPTVTAPADAGPVEATGPLTAVAHGSATAFDLVGVVDQHNDAPAAFEVGVTTINWFAQDAAGNIGSATSTVTVVDTTPPVIDPMADITGVEATGPSGAIVTYANPATSDLVDGSGTAACAPGSGATFALGSTTVACTAADARGNAALPVTFQVTVVDTTAPTVTPPANVTAEATGPLTPVAIGSATATDAVGVVHQYNDAPASFPLGSTTVTWFAVDAAGNTGNATSTVTVVDTTAPAFDPYADVHAVATGNSEAIVSYALPTASDLVDGAVAVTCLPASDSIFAAGSTAVTCTAQDVRTPPNVATMTFHVHVTYPWTGFFRPVDNAPVWNSVKAGSAIPVKFSLGGNQGLGIMAAGSPVSGMVACSTTVTDEVTETVTAGQSSLTYDAGASQYVYVWKTDKGWSNTCRVLQLRLRDGTTHSALFKFNK